MDNKSLYNILIMNKESCVQVFALLLSIVLAWT